ncbi:hypothetical protein CS0771_02280 [Catellatospora sp. IY07-71]|uniref:hypothetical protein n=1 Tax=Catellatospora sp. IY07-71 TaxID=2728827 RepID=UPI001BB37C4E|nr:hypothetical protein [Catellatospora sp. IY07-71]BCJ70684.1 hypothetical protein CS0771_02280 [Catellatospora sp. IY07-71]
MKTTTVEAVRFDSSDLRWAKALAAITGTAQYGLRRFPEPPAYHEVVARLAEQPEAPALSRLCALAQRDWHTRGQNGCQFARLVAKDADTVRWDYHVLDVETDADSEATAAGVCELVAGAVADPHVQVASILAPGIATAGELVELIRALVRRGPFWLERDDLADGLRRLFVRYPVDADTQAWAMAFAPFDFIPNTRRGPYAELAIRVKPKPEWVFHRSSQEREIAHLADTPLTMSDRHWEDRWWSTKRRTEMILGAKPDDVSAAKATLTVPAQLLA